MGSSVSASPKIQSILPVLEKVHGTKGWEETRKAAEAKASGTKARR